MKTHLIFGSLNFPAGSLADARPSTGRFDEAQTWRLITDLLSALSAAHRASILHLDVKPSNVLLDGNGGFVLTDFSWRSGRPTRRTG